jgi:hypothetical protein
MAVLCDVKNSDRIVSILGIQSLPDENEFAFFAGEIAQPAIPENGGTVHEAVVSSKPARALANAPGTTQCGR